jgi:hypothetical protein
VGIDPIAVAVHHHLMVIPTEGGEVVGMVVTTQGAGKEVMDPEPVTALPAIDGAEEGEGGR